jgi:hypothetical protein
MIVPSRSIHCAYYILEQRAPDFLVILIIQEGRIPGLHQEDLLVASITWAVAFNSSRKLCSQFSTAGEILQHVQRH